MAISATVIACVDIFTEIGLSGELYFLVVDVAALALYTTLEHGIRHVRNIVRAASGEQYMLRFVEFRVATLAIEFHNLFSYYCLVLHSRMAVQTFDFIFGDVYYMEAFSLTDFLETFLFEVALVTPVERYIAIPDCDATVARLTFDIKISDVWMIRRTSFLRHRVA